MGVDIIALRRARDGAAAMRREIADHRIAGSRTAATIVGRKPCRSAHEPAARTSGKAPLEDNGTAITEAAPPFPDPTKPDPAKPDPEKPDPAKPDPTNPDPAKPDPAKPDQANVSKGAPPVRAKAVGASNRERPAPGGMTLRERGIKRVEAGSTIHSTADESGVAVFRFSFNHAAR